MSGSQSGGGPDPSMDDILASIRRILNEEESGPPDTTPMRPPPAADVFPLDASMLVPEPDPEPAAARPAPEPEPVMVEPPAPIEPEPVAKPIVEPPPASWQDTLVAPAAAAAAAQSVGSLRRTLEAGRASMAVRSGGPTLDDIVREELRPILKAWLDAHLPPIVERLVRAEIERVVGRADL